MTVHVAPPTSYRHWTGHSARVRRADELDASWPTPTVDYRPFPRVLSYTLPPTGDGPWMHLGWAPRPTTAWARFWHHWHHGRLMRYPPFSVLVFSLWAATNYGGRCR